MNRAASEGTERGKVRCAATPGPSSLTLSPRREKILLYKDERKIAFVLRRWRLIKCVLGEARSGRVPATATGVALKPPPEQRDESARELIPCATFNIWMDGKPIYSYFILGQGLQAKHVNPLLVFQLIVFLTVSINDKSKTISCL